MTDILTLGKITSLALVNSVNPCQIAMLVMVLVAILTQNPGKRKKVLFSGLAFIIAVFIGYLFYGIILVQLFQTFTYFLRQGAIYVKYFFAALSMLVGGLQIKDFFFYKRGSFATEMPLSFRPKAKRINQQNYFANRSFHCRICNNFVPGPCTMAPLLIATESLSQLGIIGALPWLMYFNFIIVLPLIAITLIIYSGFTTAEHVSEWKERNVRILHLIAGILLFGIGISILLGWL